MAKKHSGELPKHDLDNRSRQLNSENDAYWSSRGLDRPPQDSGSQPAVTPTSTTSNGHDRRTK